MNSKFSYSDTANYELNEVKIAHNNFIKMLNKTKKYIIAIIVSVVVIFSYSPQILAQIESLYNSSTDQFAGISNLMSAVANSDTDGVKFFSKGGPMAVNQKNKGGATALHIASRQNDFEIVKILIENGANPNIQDNEGWTPLMRASIVGSSQIVDLLLSNGAKANFLNSQNESAIIHSAISRCTQCINIIIEKGNLAKEMDTLILKSQIADAFLIARNQEHKINQGMFESFLDYVSKISPLTIKSNVANNANDNLPLNIKDKSFILKSPEAYKNNSNDNSYDFLTDPNDPNPSLSASKQVYKDDTAIKYPPQYTEIKELDLNSNSPKNKYVFKKLNDNKPQITPANKPVNLQNLNIENSKYPPAPVKQFKFKSLQGDPNNLPNQTIQNKGLGTSLVQPVKTPISSVPNLTPNGEIKKFKFISNKNNINDLSKKNTDNNKLIQQTPVSPNAEAINSIDPNTIQLIEKKNIKNISGPALENNSQYKSDQPAQQKSLENKNYNLPPKIYRFKTLAPTNNQNTQPEIQNTPANNQNTRTNNENTQSEIQNTPTKKDNNNTPDLLAPKKFKFNPTNNLNSSDKPIDSKKSESTNSNESDIPTIDISDSNAPQISNKSNDSQKFSDKASAQDIDNNDEIDISTSVKNSTEDKNISKTPKKFKLISKSSNQVPEKNDAIDSENIETIEF